MNIKITGKDIKATEAIKDYLEKKMDRIGKYFDEDIDASMTIKSEKNEQIAELQILVKGETYRAVTAHKDLYASMDKDIDILEGQIRKWKTKRDRQMKDDTLKAKLINTEGKHTEIENEVMKTIYYEIKPISVEDAILKLQEKPGDRFITFINVDTGKVNVLYRMKDNKNYGLVEPET